MLFFLDSFPNQNQTSQCAFISLTPFTTSSTYQFPKPDSLPCYYRDAHGSLSKKFSISNSCFSSFHPSSNFSLLGIILVILPPNSKSQASLYLFSASGDYLLPPAAFSQPNSLHFCACPVSHESSTQCGPNYRWMRH